MRPIFCSGGNAPCERHSDYAKKVQATLQNTGLRVEVDHRNEKMGAKIRDLTLQKLPHLLVVGTKRRKQARLVCESAVRAIRAECH